MRIFFLLIFLSHLVAGCAVQRIQDRDQWLAESSRVYKNRDEEQIIRAAEAILNSADPGDFVFVHHPRGFRATRQWFVTVIVASAAGNNTYEFSVERVGDGVRASIMIDQFQNGAGKVNVSVISSYRLFFNWLDYALGLGKEWVTCEQASEKFQIENANLAPGICGPGITSQGLNPVQPKAEWTRDNRVPPIAPVSDRRRLERR